MPNDDSSPRGSIGVSTRETCSGDRNTGLPRVSTTGQDLDTQLAALIAAGVGRGWASVWALYDNPFIHTMIRALSPHPERTPFRESFSRREAAIATFRPYLVDRVLQEGPGSRCTPGFRVQSPQRRAEIGVRVGARQHRHHIAQRLVDVDAPFAGSIQRADGGCAAVCLDAVDEHRPALGSQLLYRPHGVEQHEVEVVVLTLLVDEADIEVFHTGGQVHVFDPAQRHDRVHFLGQLLQSGDAADPHLVVVGMLDGLRASGNPP